MLSHDMRFETADKPGTTAVLDSRAYSTSVAAADPGQGKLTGTRRCSVSVFTGGVRAHR
jgi:hypothetical protein